MDDLLLDQVGAGDDDSRHERQQLPLVDLLASDHTEQPERLGERGGNTHSAVERLGGMLKHHLHPAPVLRPGQLAVQFFPVEAEEAGSRLADEREVFLSQAQAEGKPPEIAERIVEGKMGKFYSEAVLLEQAFVKDPDVTVGKLLSGKGAKPVAFVRFEVGEGIEKKEDNFVEEVMAQVKGAG